MVARVKGAVAMNSPRFFEKNLAKQELSGSCVNTMWSIFDNMQFTRKEAHYEKIS